jgi:hypothetical protein
MWPLVDPENLNLDQVYHVRLWPKADIFIESNVADRVPKFGCKSLELLRGKTTGYACTGSPTLRYR